MLFPPKYGYQNYNTYLDILELIFLVFPNPLALDGSWWYNRIKDI